MPTVYLSITINHGDHVTNLENTLEALSGLVKIEKRSSFQQMKQPGEMPKAVARLTMCVVGSTELSPQCLLVGLNNLQTRIGRNDGRENRISEIVINTLFYDDVVMTYGDKQIPLAQIENKVQILEALNEIAPELVHPESDLPIADLLKAHGELLPVGLEKQQTVDFVMA